MAYFKHHIVEYDKNVKAGYTSKTVHINCDIVGTYGKDEVFIKVRSWKHFPKNHIIRVLRTEVSNS